MRTSQAAVKMRNKNIFMGVFVLFIVVLIAGGSAYFYFTREASLDKISMCPATGPSGHIVLLVDKTDPLTFIQKQSFLTFLEDLTERRIEPGYLLSVFVIGENYKDAALPLFEMCNPGKGENKSAMTANLKQLQRQYHDRFREPMLKLADTLQASKPAQFSPIFEMTQLVAINGFHKSAVNGPHRLIIVSDMLHNTPQFSMYRGNSDFQTLQNSDYGKKLMVDLKGVEVELHYVMNTPQLQNRRHLRFWEEFFNNAGARIVSVMPMEG